MDFLKLTYECFGYFIAICAWVVMIGGVWFLIHAIYVFCYRNYKKN